MKTGIAGSGVMGSGIAICSILAGYETVLYDIQDAALERSKKYIESEMEKSVAKGKLLSEAKDQALKLLSFTKELNELKADLILEAALEKLDIKRELFSKLEHINGAETIYATNTSSIPITQIALGLKNPSNLVGIHFFNPAQLMKLVEIIKGASTSEKVATIAFNWAVSLGKHAVYANDAPGFIVNRVARPYYVEGLKIAEENVAEFQAIDRLCEASGFRLGPFRLMDLIGVETNFSVTSSMYEQFHQEPRFRPSRIQQQMVDAGRHGRKTGKGFYDYEE
ncbi:MAG: 3-hydroxybutyryl-CoA dehydrogenase [Bacteroidetes bacterium]|nr:3-hydroxybutyryl-CoA dehydrogenase [Bacteroidota bacterium]